MSLESYIRECTRRYIEYEDDIRESTILQEFINNGYNTPDKFIDLIKHSDCKENKEIIKKVIDVIDNKLLSLNITNVPSYNYETLTISPEKENQIKYFWKTRIGG